MTAVSQRLRRPASAEIYEDLRQSIVRLELAPGSFIYETALAEKYGASRTPVRQALARLERDQLLEVLPQRGAQVAPLSIRLISEAQEVREILEIASIGTLARDWDDGALRYRLIEDQLAENLEQQTDAASRNDVLSFVALDGDFHSLLLGAADNVTLQRHVESVRLHLQRLRYLELEFMHHELRSVEQHRELVALVRENDSDAARQAMAAHLALAADIRHIIYSRRADLFKE